MFVCIGAFLVVPAIAVVAVAANEENEVSKLLNAKQYYNTFVKLF